MVEPGDDLPRFVGSKKLYLDYETTSGDPDETSLNTWKTCYIAGVAVTGAEGPAYYIPFDHRDGRWNYPRAKALAWLEQLMLDVETIGSEWVNHNVKYDMHVSRRYELPIPSRVSCTLTRAKLVDSDRKFKGGYGLDSLAMAWLERDIRGYERTLKAYLKGCNSRDYGDVPADILGEYACEDVIVTRLIDRYIERVLPQQCRGVELTEKKLTPVLFDMEVVGLRVDPVQLAVEELKATTRLLDMEEQICELVGNPVRPHVNEDCFALLCGRHGLPVLAWTDKKEPSFDKNTLASYAKNPTVSADPKLLKIVRTMLEYRKLNTLCNLFIRKYRELEVDGVLHPSFNQCVSTGRKACSEPNMQQLSEDAKRLILAPKDGAILSADYSQIEFRLIVHLINNQKAIQAYNEQPDIDFHQWVADMAGMLRSPAKNLNFAMGYGAGKPKTLFMLENDPTVSNEVASIVDQLIADKKVPASKRAAATEYFLKERSESVYAAYHAMLPELKTMQRLAQDRVKQRGYVFDLYGRHRHLPVTHAFAAFNSVVQASAADLMKERVVAIAPRYNKRTRDLGLQLACVVHDELVFTGPRDALTDPDTYRHVAGILEAPSIPLRIPIRTSISVSTTTWGATKKGKVDDLLFRSFQGPKSDRPTGASPEIGVKDDR